MLHRVELVQTFESPNFGEAQRRKTFMSKMRIPCALLLGSTLFIIVLLVIILAIPVPNVILADMIVAIVLGVIILCFGLVVFYYSLRLLKMFGASEFHGLPIRKVLS
jgi:hypothetical protein